MEHTACTASHPSDQTLVGYFLANAAAHPTRPFLELSEHGIISYEQALGRLGAVVEWLEDAGIGRGSIVPCYADATIPIVYLMLACAALGAVPVPLSPVFSPTYFMMGIVRQLGATAVFTMPSELPAFEGSGLRILGFDEQSRTQGPVSMLAAGASLDPRACHNRLSRLVAGVRGADVFMIQPTAGSTGLPKLVPRRHVAFTRYAHFVGDEIRDPSGASDRMLMAAALTHAFGLHMLTTALRLGATLAIPSRLDTATPLAEVRRLDPTILPLLPRVQRALHRSACQASDEERIFGPSARVVCSAGGTPHAPLLGAVARQGLRVIEFYGSSEASVVAVTPRADWRPPFAGRIVPDAQVRIARDGEILVMSPGVASGYVNDEAATGSCFDGGYFRTGDFGEVSADGFLRVVGRKCDVFNTPEGTNIHPRRIEEMLEGLAWAEQVVLVGDQLPFIAALIAVSPDSVAPGAASVATDTRGQALDPRANRALYARATADVGRLNQGLEHLERVRRVALFAERFPEDVYRVVNGGKIRRDRLRLASRYAQTIAWLYAPVDGLGAAHVCDDPPAPLMTGSRAGGCGAATPRAEPAWRAGSSPELASGKELR